MVPKINFRLLFVLEILQHERRLIWLNPLRMSESQIFREAHLRQIFKAYATYGNNVRTHFALTKGAAFSSRPPVW
jgi:hypothetical protein